VSKKEQPSLKDLAFLAAPIWGPVSLSLVFMLLPSPVGYFWTPLFFGGLIAFPVIGLRGLLRTSSAGPMLKVIVGAAYFFPAMLFCGLSFRVACVVLLGGCKP
jgi:hypothetical protein